MIVDVVAKFQFNYPPKAAEADEDGDLIVSRKSTGNEFGILEIGKKTRDSFMIKSHVLL